MAEHGRGEAEEHRPFSSRIAIAPWQLIPNTLYTKHSYYTWEIHSKTFRKFGRFLMGLVQMGSEEFSLFFSLFFRFSVNLLEDKGNRLQFTAKWGIHSDPVCTDPVQNFLESVSISVIKMPLVISSKTF